METAKKELCLSRGDRIVALPAKTISPGEMERGLGSRGLGTAVEPSEKNKTLLGSQHGFRRGRSILTQMQESMNDWTIALDDKKEVLVIYFKFRKAFDKVNHSKLSMKLEHVGIHDKIVRWVE
ncbi:hypothetical protein COOONC_02526 [Cooperia oncophora]